MDCLDRYNARMKKYGGNIRGEKVRNSINLISDTFVDDAAFNDGVYIWELGIKDYSEKQPINIRLYERSFSDANGWRVKFQSTLGYKVVVGDVLYDSTEDEYFICTESFNIDNIHYQGRLTLCNWILKWQSKTTGEILEYPCYDMNTTQYNSGEKSNREFTIGSSQHMLTLPCDENTVVLNTPQRFYLDKNTNKPTTFIVTQNDTTSYNIGKKGLVKVTVLENVRDSDKDRPDLGVCDYIDPETIEESPISEIKAVIDYKSKIIKSGGDTQVFTALFYDKDDNLITDIVPEWRIICDFEDKLEVSKSGNQISISIDDDDYIDEEFKLVLYNPNDSTETEMIIQIESLL